MTKTQSLLKNFYNLLKISKTFVNHETLYFFIFCQKSKKRRFHRITDLSAKKCKKPMFHTFMANILKM